jgi:uncharacterized membrane protein
MTRKLKLQDWFPRDRLETLTDGIYAVALTLLVLNLKLPTDQLGAGRLSEALLNQLPNLLTWLLSFWVILIYWEAQVRLSRLVEQVDQTVLRLDYVHLGLISLLPFSTSLVGLDQDQRLAVLIYTGNLWLISALSVAKIRHSQETDQNVAANQEFIEMAYAAKLMLVAMTAALLLAYVLPGWNLCLLLLPKFFSNKPR